MKPFNSMITRLALLGLAVCLQIGCQAASFDIHTFTSTVNHPVTVNLIASQTGGAILWSKEVPVNHRLRVDLNTKGDIPMVKVDPQRPATGMSWTLSDLYGSRLESGRMDLPGVPVYLQTQMRPSPEFPADFTPPGAEIEPTPMEIIDVKKEAPQAHPEVDHEAEHEESDK